MIIKKIYIKLLNEGLDVWRPVNAKMTGNNVFEILNNNHANKIEEWEFSPGDTVKCVYKLVKGKKILIAYKKIVGLE